MQKKRQHSAGQGTPPGPSGPDPVGPSRFRSVFRRRTGIRVGVLAVLIALQAVSVLFFLGDVFADVMALGLDRHTTYEAVATLALALGVCFGAVEMVRTIRLGRRAEAALKMASGAFSEVLNDRFTQWDLTPSESDVALLTLKGFDGPQIADLRGTAAGTVRAQLGHIYAKSGCNGRGQFVSLFIDALLDEPLGVSP